MNWLIKKYEGFSATPYLCPAGVPTIGYGTTVYPNGTKVSVADMAISEEAASTFLDSYVMNNIMPHIRNLDLTDNQKTALVSLIYNIGWNAFAKSKCYDAIKKKNWGVAYKEWDWITGGGKVLNGLIKRREEERYLFFMDI